MATSTKIISEKVPNMRDLGGMKTADGKVIKCGLLIRSEQLYYASENDKELLKSIPLKQIFDFRNTKEVNEKPDPLLDGCENLHLPIIDESTLLSWESRRSKEAKKQIEETQNNSETVINKMCEMYRNLIRAPYSCSQYSKFLKGVLDTHGTVLWHCTLGKDRCGWGSVLVETVLGVSKEDIIEDYLYTNECLKDELVKYFEKKNITPSMIKQNSLMTAVVEARTEYIMAAFDEVEKLYGSMDAYLKDGLGVDENMIARFREKYLA